MLLEVAIVVSGLSCLLLTKDKKPAKVKISKPWVLSDITGDGLRISKNVRLSTKFSNEHCLVVAPSGAGKSRRIVMPNVKFLENSTLIITDPSGEIAEECGNVNRIKIIFNPYSSNSIGYDPLYNCKTESEVRKAAQTILTNGSLSISQLTGNRGSSSNHADWINMSVPLITAYMLWNWHTKKYTFDKLVYRLVSASLKDIGNEIMKSNIDSAKAEFMSFMQVVGAPTTLACIRNVINSSLQIFFDYNVKRIMQKPSIDFSKLRSKQHILYIQIPEKESEYFAPITALFVTQMIDRIIEQKGLQVYCLFDELCNIGYIPTLCKTLSTCRKRNISITGCIQSLTQLDRVYGEVQAKELRELFKTIVVMPGLKDSAEYISNILGVQEIIKQNQRYTKPVLTADEIRRLDSDKCLLICHNQQPVIDYLYKY